MELERRAVSRTMLTMLLIGMLTLTFNIRTAKAEPRTWTVDDDGPADFNTIQEAINAASDGDTIGVYQGTYHENIIINKSVSLIGENRENTVIDGDFVGRVIYVETSNVMIRGFTLRNGGSGVSIYKSYNVTVQNNIITNNGGGVFLRSSSNNTISLNNVTSNGYGVTLFWLSDNNTISLNNIKNNGYGVMLTFGSSSNTISDNNITNNNSYGISLNKVDCNGNRISSNNINDNGDGIHLTWSSSNNIISGNSLSNNNVCGIYLGSYCRGNSVLGNKITNNGNGIMLFGCGESSGGNILRNNNMTKNACNFGAFHGSSPRYLINDVDSSNIVDGKPIYYWTNVQDMAVPSDAGYVALINCNNITVEGLELKGNSQGILLAITTNSTLANNVLVDNANGVYICFASHNNEVSSNIMANNEVGISFYRHCLNNTVYHNNFINNTQQATFVLSKSAVWDNGYPSGGNYWSDYSTRYPHVGDEYNGENQDIVGSDGIWDHPYEIDVDNIDNYPLVEPWGPLAALKELIGTIEAWNLPRGTENCLVSKLDDAIHLLEKTNENGAIHKLMDFTDQVEALRSIKLTNEQTDQLITEAQRIINLIKR